MKVQLEVFFTKFVDGDVVYLRKNLDISKHSDNPDLYVDEIVESLAEKLNIDKEKCLIHSTSWRCAHCDLISLTYIIYSDSLKLPAGKTKSIPISNLSLSHGTANKARPVHLEEKNIVAHALRHVSLLVKNNPEIYQKGLTPISASQFAKIGIALAGKIT